MTPEQIAALDASLARALTLYYDRRFAQALPIFRQVADKVETLDIMFWLGTSAAAVGETDLAVAKFKRMLAIDPDLHRVRLELASVYFAAERYADARRELEIVLAAAPPPEVAANVRRMREAIDARTRKYAYTLRLDTGYMSDDNVSSGPDPGLYTFAGGTSFRPSATMAKLYDEASVTRFAGGFLYDPGDRQGLLWNTVANAFYKAYQTYSQFDYLAVDINTGPWWATGNSVLKIPAGITCSEYASDRLSYMLHVDPGYTWFANPNLSLTGTYRLRSEKFHEAFRADDFDNTAQVVEFSPAVYLGDRRHMIAAIVGYESYAAENDAHSYQAPVAGIHCLARFPTGTELFLGYQWTERDYEGMQAFPYAGLGRKDGRHSYTAVLSQTFFRHFNLSYTAAYIENRSNLALNRWDKTTHTISIGCQF